jgi:thiamine transporter
MNRKKLLMMMEIAIFASIGLVLDQLSFKIVPQGGSISLVMLPIIFIALRWGLVAGLTTGLLVGVLQMMFGAYILHWAQGLLDYVVAFTAIGLAGVLRRPIQHTVKAHQLNKLSIYVLLATCIGGVLRFIAHVLAGVVFFKEYAGDQNVWLYAITYNATFMLPAIILTAIVTVLLVKASPKLIQANHH